MTLKPSGVLSMIAEWEDTPKDGVTYEIYLLTTLYSTGSVQLHKLVNLVFNTTKMSYNIPSGVQNQFVAGNGATVGNFPGFKLDNQYRVYIRYLNASNFLLNKAGGSVEMSLYAAAMVQASAPTTISACEPMDATFPCVVWPSWAFSAKILWTRPSSVGYNVYYPSVSYTYESYIVEISDNINFTGSIRVITCAYGITDSACATHSYGVTSAFVQNLSAAPTYYFRVSATTVVGRGITSLTGSIGRCKQGYSGSDGTACILNYTTCLAGTYASETPTLCIDCPAGKYSADRATTCTACASGKYSPYPRMVSILACWECSYSKYSNEGASMCVGACPPGTYNEVGPGCTYCPSGTYQNTTGATQCVNCARGTYSPVVAATDASTCLLCPLNSDSPAQSISDSSCTCNVGYSGEVVS